MREIAEELGRGISTNAVAAKIRRLGIAEFPPYGGAPGRRRAAKKILRRPERTSGYRGVEHRYVQRPIPAVLSSSAGRSRSGTSRTVPRIARAPIGGRGSRHNVSRCRACVTPRATQIGPSCLATKLPLYADRLERKNERTIKTVR